MTELEAKELIRHQIFTVSPQGVISDSSKSQMNEKLKDILPYWNWGHLEQRDYKHQPANLVTSVGGLTNLEESKCLPGGSGSGFYLYSTERQFYCSWFYINMTEFNWILVNS